MQNRLIEATFLTLHFFALREIVLQISCVSVQYCNNVFGLFALLHIVLILNLIKICNSSAHVKTNRTTLHADLKGVIGVAREGHRVLEHRMRI